jgi:short subunit dehydrogenase-like uncharacterized protein
MKRPFDLILYGATGFTGRETARYLTRHIPAGVRWAIAGRDRGRLEQVADSLKSIAAGVLPELLTADPKQPTSIGRLVAKTRVLLQLAGPYSEFGERFVAACVRHETHYLDLTGEIPWVARLVEKWDAPAQTARVKIVPVAGFEALPFDLIALRAAQRLKSEHRCRAARIRVINRFTGPRAWRPRDVLSGGTTASIRLLLSQAYTQTLADPAALVSDPAQAEAIRAVGAYDFTPTFDAGTHAWLAPTLPAPFVNPPVVYRTISALSGTRASPFTPECRYEEFLTTAGMAPFAIGQRALAEALAYAFRGAMSPPGPWQMAQREALGKLLDWWGPKTGEGPSERVLIESGYELTATASGAKGESVTVLAKAAGHPGYRSTAHLVAEAALILAGVGGGTSALPRRYGVLTPALALGSGMGDRWRRAGLVFSETVHD